MNVIERIVGAVLDVLVPFLLGVVAGAALMALAA